MRLGVLFSFLSTLVFASACSKWPPEHEDLVDLFVENRHAFEQLESKILDTNFVRISGGCVLNSEHERAHNRVEFSWEEKDPVSEELFYDRETIEDKEWSDLFCATRVWSVAHFDGVVSFDFGSGVERRGKFVNAAYVHSKNRLSKRKACLPEHKNLDCGLCAVAIDDEWFVDYWWTPEDILPEESEDMIEGILSEDEYWARFDDELKRCRIDGYTAIGYDAADWWDQESNDR